MELIIQNVNVTEKTEIVKSVNWSYGEISGLQEIKEPNLDNFISLENLTNDIVKSWLNELIDFKEYKNIIIEESTTENIISVVLNN